MLRTGHRNQVFIDRDLWPRFGSADAVNAALRAVVELSRALEGSVVPRTRRRGRAA
jgi:hypothetical protein